MAARRRTNGRGARFGRRDFSGRTELVAAGLRRRANARALLERKDPAHTLAAMYLGGYVIECKLKSILMEAYGCWTLRELAAKMRLPPKELYEHGLEALLKKLPRLHQRIMESSVRRDFTDQVNKWRVDWRYSPRLVPMSDALGFMRSVERVADWLDSNRW